MKIALPLQFNHNPNILMQQLREAKGPPGFADLISSLDQRNFSRAAELSPDIGSAATPFGARALVSGTSLSIDQTVQSDDQSDQTRAAKADLGTVTDWIKHSVAGVDSRSGNPGTLPSGTIAVSGNSNAPVTPAANLATTSPTHVIGMRGTALASITDAGEFSRAVPTTHAKSDVQRNASQRSASLLASQEFNRPQGQSFFAAILQADDGTLRVILRGLMMSTQERMLLESSIDQLLKERGFHNTEFHITKNQSEVRQTDGV